MENKEKMPEWDLSEYYNGVDDPKIGEDLNAYADKAAAFAAKYRGKVAGLDGAAFVAALKELEEMSWTRRRKKSFWLMNRYAFICRI